MPGDKSQPVDCLSGISSIPAGKIDAVISPENESWIKQLQEINTEIAGRLRIEGTNIDGLILQSEDNTKYLTAGYDGKANPAGAFFLDYECESDFSGQHNIIYGHNMKNGSMFHDLLNFKKESCFFLMLWTQGSPVCYDDGERWINSLKIKLEVDKVKKLMRITTVSLILSCVMAVPVFAGKWVGDDGGWRYVRDDGSYQEDGWLEDKGELYYISNGYMKTGWVNHDGKDYFMGVTGAMKRNGVTPDGFKVGSDGAWLGPESVIDERGFTTPYDDHSYFLDEDFLGLIFDAETDYAEELGRWGMSDIRILAAVRGIYPISALNEKEAAVYQKTAEFISGFNYQLSDREKAEYVYEYIQERAVYDTGEFKPDSDTIYGVLILGKSECVGFARTYKLLSNAVGLRCGISENAAHVWNSVMIDGEWKGIDVSTIGTSPSFYLDRRRFSCSVCGTSYTFGARESAWTCPVCDIEYDNPSF